MQNMDALLDRLLQELTVETRLRLIVAIEDSVEREGAGTAPQLQRPVAIPAEVGEELWDAPWTGKAVPGRFIPKATCRVCAQSKAAVDDDKFRIRANLMCRTCIDARKERLSETDKASRDAWTNDACVNCREPFGRVSNVRLLCTPCSESAREYRRAARKHLRGKVGQA